MSGGEICDNTASVGGGGIFGRSGRIEIKGGSIHDNKAGRWGGALYIYGSVDAVISGQKDSPVEIRDNSCANLGGAICQDGGVMSMNNVRVLNNKTTATGTGYTNSDSCGGGITVWNGRLSIGDGTLVKGNYAVRGGGIWNNKGTVYMTGGKVTKNNAQLGGGIAMPADKNATSYFTLMGGGLYGNHSLSVTYGNDVYCRYTVTGDEISPMTSSRVQAVTIVRVISGIAFLDRDQDGNYVAGTRKYPSNDRKLSGITVTLYKAADDRESSADENDSGTDTADVFTVGGKKYVRAMDTIGNVLDPVVTGASTRSGGNCGDGSYKFEGMPEGDYLVVFTAPAGQDGYPTYAGTDYTKTLLPFGRLSVTKAVYSDPDNRQTVTINKAMKSDTSYQTSADSSEADALTDSVLQNAVSYTTVRMPAKKDITSERYVSGSWNLGLYYKEISLTKNWYNMVLGMTKGTSVDFKITGYQDNSATYTVSRKNTGTGHSDLTLSANTAAWASTGNAKVTEKASCPTYIWTLDYIAVQAENGDGPISYKAEESGFSIGGSAKTQDTKKPVNAGEDGDGSRNFDDFIVSGSIDMKADETYGNTLEGYTDNWQRLYHLGLVKVKEEDHGQTLSGAKFILYRDTNGASGLQLTRTGSIAADAVMNFTADSGAYTLTAAGKTQTLETGADGSLNLKGLPEGTYYLRETVAPKGRYSLTSEEDYWTITVSKDPATMAKTADQSGDSNGSFAFEASSSDTDIVPNGKAASEDSAYYKSTSAASLLGMKEDEWKALSAQDQAEKLEDVWLIPNVPVYRFGIVKVAEHDHSRVLGYSSSDVFKGAEFALYYDADKNGSLNLASAGGDGSGAGTDAGQGSSGAGADAGEESSHAAVRHDRQVTFRSLNGGKAGSYLLDWNKGTITTVMTAEDGSLNFEGLPAGTYFLKETKAPKGAVLSKGGTYWKFKIERDTVTDPKETASDYSMNGKVTGETVNPAGNSAENGSGNLNTAAAYKDEAYRKSLNLKNEGTLSDQAKAALQEEHDTWLIPNPEIYQLNLVKVASEDHATVLTGAKFRFYRDTNGNGKLDLAEGASDAMMGFHVKSAGNYIYDDGGRISSAVTSELAMTDNGTLDLSGLPAGTYFLKETTAPEGRHIWGSDNEYWTFKIRYDASVASVYPDGTGSITGGVTTGASSVIPLVKASEDEAYTANLTETQKAELVSNGTWLVPNLSRKLVDTGLDEKAKQYWMLVLAAMAGFALLLMAEDRKRKSRGR